MKHKIKPLDIIMLLILVISIGIFLYPFIQNQLNTIIDQKVINIYQNQANNENSIQRKKMQEQQAENEKLAAEKSAPGLSAFNNAIENTENKKKVPIDYYTSNTIGVLYIPKIKVKLPIFNKTNDTLLNKGASLLEGSSYPSHDNSAHSVISAHRGLPEAKLFTDLPKLEIGDEFFIEINDEKLAYKVIETRVIEPTDTDALVIQDDKNLVTLLTCTPYMINTHRLIVTGEQIPYQPKYDQAIQNISKWQKYQLILTSLAIFVLLAIVSFILIKWYRRFLISKKEYAVELILLNKKQQPLSFQKVILRPKSKNKKSIHLSSDEKGQVKVPSLTGGTYYLSLTKGRYKKAQPVKLRIKRVKDSHFKAKVTNKKQNYHLSINDQNPVSVITYQKNHLNKNKNNKK